jgi:hypothetical protein
MANNFFPARGYGQDDPHRIFLVYGLGDYGERVKEQPYGVWKIESFTGSDVLATLALREQRAAADIKLPRNEFDRTTYPNMLEDDVGKSISIGYGPVFGAKATLIDSQTSRFKWLDHSVLTADRFAKADGETFTPDTINTTLSEFTYAAWDGQSELFVDYTADLNNFVDLAKEILTGSVRGAGLPLSALDTTSIGKGFGTNGARLAQIKGTLPRTGAEVPIHSASIHISEPTEIRTILNQIQAACFGFIFVDYNGLWQFKPWEPVPGDGLDVITEDIIIGDLKPTTSATGAITKVVSKYRRNLSTDSFQRVVAENDELRQLRGQPAHLVLEKELPISDREGARDWAQRTVAMRGRPRRIFKFTATAELKLAEPGDYKRLTYAQQGIDEIVLITKVTRTAGNEKVGIEAIDNFGFGVTPGFWTADTLTFPAELGGGSFTDYDDADTPEKKKWVKENWGIWHNDNGYIDESDPFYSHRLSVWV